MFSHLTRLSLMLLLIAPIVAQSKQSISVLGTLKQTGILVTGQGEVSVAPNMAYLTLSIIERDISIKKARTAANAVVDKAVGVLNQFEVDLENVNTSFINIQPEYLFQENKRIFSGYKVSRTIVINLRDLSKLGGVIEGLLDTGINQLSPPQFGSTHENDLINQALALAVKNAKASAKIIAENLNARLGKPVEVIQQNQNVDHPVAFQANIARRSGNNSAKNHYATGQIVFKASVQVRFNLH